MLVYHQWSHMHTGRKRIVSQIRGRVFPAQNNFSFGTLPGCLARTCAVSGISRIDTATGIVPCRLSWRFGNPVTYGTTWANAQPRWTPLFRQGKPAMRIVFWTTENSSSKLTLRSRMFLSHSSLFRFLRS